MTYKICYWDDITQSQSERDATPDEIAEIEYRKANRDSAQSATVRSERDKTLAESDWRVIKSLESNIPQDFAWAEYRQALRDVTAQNGFPWLVVWPTEPV